MMSSSVLLWTCTQTDSIKQLHLTWDEGMLFLMRMNTPNSQQGKLINLG